MLLHKWCCRIGVFAAWAVLNSPSAKSLADRELFCPIFFTDGRYSHRTWPGSVLPLTTYPDSCRLWTLLSSQSTLSRLDSRHAPAMLNCSSPRSPIKVQIHEHCAASPRLVEEIPCFLVCHALAESEIERAGSYSQTRWPTVAGRFHQGRWLQRGVQWACICRSWLSTWSGTLL